MGKAGKWHNFTAAFSWLRQITGSVQIKWKGLHKGINNMRLGHWKAAMQQRDYHNIISNCKWVNCDLGMLSYLHNVAGRASFKYCVLNQISTNKMCMCFHLESCGVGTVIVPNLQRRKPKNRELKCLVWSDSAVLLQKLYTYPLCCLLQAVPDTYKRSVNVI